MTDRLRLQVVLAAVDRMTRPLREVAGASRNAGRALQEARSRLKELNQQQANITGYRRQREATRQSSEALAAAQARLREYKEQLRGMDAPSAAFQRRFTQTATEVQRLTIRHQAQRSELQRLIQAVRAGGANTRDLGSAERRLRVDMEATNQVIEAQRARLAALARQQARSEAARSRYAGGRELAGNAASAGASALATATAAGLPVLGAIKQFSSFEDAMAGVAKQVDGARDDNGQLTQTYYDMAAGIKAMSETIPMATADIAALVEGGARMGIQGKEDLLSFAKVAATAATAFELPAEEVSQNLARIANLYKVPIKDISKLGDTINYLDDSAQSQGADIINTMQRMAGFAASMKMSFQDSAALGSTLLTLGETPETAATGISAMLRSLGNATKQPPRVAKGLKAIGLAAADVQRNMAKDATNTMFEVLERVNRLPSDKRLGVLTDLFGIDHSQKAGKLVDNLTEYRRQLELTRSTKAVGSMQREGDIKGDLLSSRWQVTRNRFDNLQSDLGATLRPVIVQVLGALNRLLGRFTEWVKANPGLVQGILKTIAGFTVLAATFGGLALGLAGVLGPIIAVRFALAMVGIRVPGLLGLLSGLATRVLPLVGQALLWLGRLAMANPIGVLITAIGTAAYLVYQHWDTVKQWLGSTWQQLTQLFSGGVMGLLTVLANFSPLGLFYQAFAAVLNYLGVDLPMRFRGLGGMLIDGLIQGLQAQLGRLKEAVTGVGGQAVDWFKEKLGIHSPSRVFAEMGGFTMQGLALGLEAHASSPLQAVLGVAKRMGDAFAGGPGLAAPALAIDNRPPLSPSAPAPVSSGATSYHINIHPAQGMDPQAIARAVSAELDRREQAKRVRGRSALYDNDQE